tara:strand:- start:1794 stop:2099 length:306 start_codon:yes stop_codon:yes gene_type:complete
MTESTVADAAHKRLDRIEEKIDKLTDFMVGIARLEEKQMSVEDDIKTILKRMDYTESKMDAVDDRARVNEVKIVIISRVFWAVVVALVIAGITVYGPGQLR